MKTNNLSKSKPKLILSMLMLTMILLMSLTTQVLAVPEEPVERWNDTGYIAAYATLTAAISAVNTGETIKLNKDFTDAGFNSIPSNSKTVTIDLGGHTLTMQNRITLPGTLTIKNGTMKRSSNLSSDYDELIFVPNRSTLNVEKDVIIEVAGTGYAIDNQGTTNINGAKITHANDKAINTSMGILNVNEGSEISADDTAIYANNTAINIDKATVKAKSGETIYLNSNHINYSVQVTDSTVSNETEIAIYVLGTINNHKHPNIPTTITDGEIKGGTNAIYLKGADLDLTVGGDAKVSSTNSAIVEAVYSSSSTAYNSVKNIITIKDNAQVSSGETNTSTELGKVRADYSNDDAQWIHKGYGTIYVKDDNGKVCIEDNASVTNTATNGYALYFAHKDITPSVKNNYITMNKTENVGKIFPEHQIVAYDKDGNSLGEYNVSCLKDIFDENNGVAKVKLLKDVTAESENLTIGHDAILDLNGYDLLLREDRTYDRETEEIRSSFSVNADKSLTITDSSTGEKGTITSGNIYLASDYRQNRAIFLQTGSGLVVSGGVTITGAYKYGTIYAACNSTDVTKTPTVTIKEGSTVTNSNTNLTENYAVSFLYKSDNSVTTHDVSDYYSGASGCTVGKIRPEILKASADKLKIVTTSAAYDGTGKSTTVSAAKDITGLGTISSLEYALVTINDDETETIGTYSSTAPTDAGTYKVRVDVADGTTYVGANDIVVGTFAITVKDGEKTLTSGTDYTVSYEDNIEVSNAAKVKVEFQGNYSGSLAKTFKIVYAGLPSETTNDDYFTMPEDTNGWYDGGETLTAKTGYTIGTTSTATGVVTIPSGTDTDEGELTVYIKNSTGNFFQTTVSYKVDTTAPVISTVAGNPADWTKEGATITFAPTDATSGIKTVEVKRAAIAPETADVAYTVTNNTSFTADQNGTYTIKITDNAGNTVTETIMVSMIDKTAPVVTLTQSNDTAFDSTKWYGTSDVTVTATETNLDTLTVTGGKFTTATDIKTAREFSVDETTAGVYTYTVTATDKADNSTSETVTINIDTIIDTAQINLADVSDSTKSAAANTWYQNLTGVQQNRIKNSDASDLVTALENALETQSQNLADDVAQKINDATTLDAILAAKTAYDALPNSAKEKVLAADKDKLTELSVNANAAKPVERLIEIASAGDAAYSEKLAAANAYDSYVELYPDNNLISDQASKVETIKDQIANITALIGKIQTAKSPYTNDEIQAIVDAYTALTSGEKNLFNHTDYKTTYDEMAKWLENIKEIEALEAAKQQAAKDFLGKVNDTLSVPTVENITALETAKDKLASDVFNSLPQDVQDKYDDLVAAKPVIEDLNNVTAENVDSTDVNDYNSLNEGQKAIVDKATGNKAGQITAALAAIVEIQAIPTHDDNSDVGTCNPDDHTIEAHKTAIETAKIAYEKLNQVGRDLVSAEETASLNKEYTALMSYLEYINHAQTATTTVEVAGLAEKVEVGDTAGITKTTVSVKAQDSKPEVAAKATTETKKELLSVDVKLVAEKFFDDKIVETKEVQPKFGAKVVVKLAVPSGYDLDTLEIWHVKDDGQSMIIKNFNIITENAKKYTVFEVESFSHFVFFADVASTSTSTGGSSAKKYNNDLETSKGGDVVVQPLTASAGTKVWITPKADKGYKVDEILVNDGDVKVTNFGDGTYYYIQPTKAVDIEVTFKTTDKVEEQNDQTKDEALTNFIDVKSGAWYETFIAEAVQKGIMQGISTKEFSPSGSTSRAMMVTVLFNMSGKPETANDGTAWYSEAQAWAINAGISDGSNMKNPLTREQLVTMLYRYAMTKGENTSATADLTIYNDYKTVANWSEISMKWAVNSDIINGDNKGNLNPKASATRAELAKIMVSYLNK